MKNLNLFGYYWSNIVKGDYHRTAWAYQVGPLRVVEWPWSGFRFQWFGKKTHQIVFNYNKGHKRLYYES